MNKSPEEAPREERPKYAFGHPEHKKEALSAGWTEAEYNEKLAESGLTQEILDTVNKPSKPSAPVTPYESFYNSNQGPVERLVIAWGYKPEDYEYSHPVHRALFYEQNGYSYDSEEGAEAYNKLYGRNEAAKPSAPLNAGQQSTVQQSEQPDILQPIEQQPQQPAKQSSFWDLIGAHAKDTTLRLYATHALKSFTSRDLSFKVNPEDVEGYEAFPVLLNARNKDEFDTLKSEAKGILEARRIKGEHGMAANIAAGFFDAVGWAASFVAGGLVNKVWKLGRFAALAARMGKTAQVANTITKAAAAGATSSVVYTGMQTIGEDVETKRYATEAVSAGLMGAMLSALPQAGRLLKKSDKKYQTLEKCCNGIAEDAANAQPPPFDINKVEAAPALLSAEKWSRSPWLRWANSPNIILLQSLNSFCKEFALKLFHLPFKVNNYSGEFGVPADSIIQKLLNVTKMNFFKPFDNHLKSWLSESQHSWIEKKFPNFKIGQYFGDGYNEFCDNVMDCLIKDTRSDNQHVNAIVDLFKTNTEKQTAQMIKQGVYNEAFLKQGEKLVTHKESLEKMLKKVNELTPEQINTQYKDAGLIGNKAKDYAYINKDGRSEAELSYTLRKSYIEDELAKTNKQLEVYDRFKESPESVQSKELIDTFFHNTDPVYFHRVYDKAAIAKDPDGFQKAVAAGLRDLWENTNPAELIDTDPLFKGLDINLSAKQLDEKINKIAQDVTYKILRGNFNKPRSNAKSVYYGPELSRSLNIRSEFVKDYIVKDVKQLYAANVETATRQSEVYRAFKTLDYDNIQKRLDEAGQKILDEIKADPALTEKQKYKKREAFLKDQAADDELVRQCWNSVLGTNNEKNIDWLAAIININTARSMGALGSAPMQDLATFTLHLGLVDTCKAVFKRYPAKWFVCSRDEIEPIIHAVDRAQIALRKADVFGQASGSAVVRGTAKVAEAVVKASGGPMIDRMTKEIAGFATHERLMKICTKLVDGKRVSAKEFEIIHSYGINDELAKRMGRQFKEHGEINKAGWWISHTDQWTDEEAVRSLGGAIESAQSTMIVTPTVGTTPAFYNNPFGRALGQFKRCMFAANTEAMLPFLQKIKDKDVLDAMSVILVSAGASYGRQLLNDAFKKRERTVEDRCEQAIGDMDLWGAGAILFDLINKSRRMWTNSYLNSIPNFPVLGAVMDAGRASMGFGHMLMYEDDGSSKRPSYAEIHAIRRLLPFNNVLYLAQTFNAVEEAIGRKYEVEKYFKEEEAKELRSKHMAMAAESRGVKKAEEKKKERIEFLKTHTQQEWEEHEKQQKAKAELQKAEERAAKAEQQKAHKDAKAERLEKRHDKFIKSGGTEEDWEAGFPKKKAASKTRRKPASKPVASAVSQPTPQPAAPTVAQPAAPVAQPVSQLISQQAQPAAQQTPQQAPQPAAQPAAQPDYKAMFKQMAEDKENEKLEKARKHKEERIEFLKTHTQGEWEEHEKRRNAEAELKQAEERAAKAAQREANKKTKLERLEKRHAEFIAAGGTEEDWEAGFPKKKPRAKRAKGGRKKRNNTK